MDSVPPPLWYRSVPYPLDAIAPVSIRQAKSSRTGPQLCVSVFSTVEIDMSDSLAWVGALFGPRPQAGCVRGRREARSQQLTNDRTGDVECHNCAPCPTQLSRLLSIRKCGTLPRVTRHESRPFYPSIVSSRIPSNPLKTKHKIFSTRQNSDGRDGPQLGDLPLDELRRIPQQSNPTRHRARPIRNLGTNRNWGAPC